MKIEELKKVVEAAKNNPDFDMNNWGECLVGSYLQQNTKTTFFEEWNSSRWHDAKYRAVARYFEISKDKAEDLFSMREEYNDIYNYNPETGEEYEPTKNTRMMVREMAIERLEEFIWENENA